MRIRKIEISNIASLKGNHAIDFDDFQTEFGSFAITGDTGSGKSTILNCIALALYGRSYKSALNQGDFITLGEAAGKIELEFSCAGRDYLSIWTCRVRKKNGEYLKAPNLSKEFYLLEAGEKKVLETSPENIIHLSFEQFCKTVILNQGEFARFLTSTFRERKDILEKLYQGDRLDAFSPLLRNKISKYSSKLEQIEAKIQGLGLGLDERVSEEALKTAEQSFLALKEIHLALNAVAHELKESVALSSKREEATQKLSNVETKIKQLSLELNDAQRELANSTRKAMNFSKKEKELSPSLHQALARKAQLEKASLKVEEYSKTLSTSKQTLRATQASADHARAEYVAAKDSVTQFEKKGFKSLNEQEFSSLLESFQAYKDSKAKLDSLTTLNRHFESSEEALRSELKDLTQKLAKADTETQDIEKALAESPTDLEEKAQDYQKALLSLASFQKEANCINTQARETEAQIKQIRQVVELSSKKLQENKTLIEGQLDALKASKLETSRHLCVKESLEQGNCIVCGSSDISPLNSPEFDDLQEKISRFETSLQKLESEKEELSHKIEREKNELYAKETILDEAKKRLEKLSFELFSEQGELLNEAQPEDFLNSSEKTFEALRRGKNEIEESAASLQKKKNRLQTLMENVTSLQERKKCCQDKIEKLKNEKSQSKTNSDKVRTDLESALAKACAISKSQDMDGAARLIENHEEWRKANTQLERKGHELKLREERLSATKARLEELKAHFESCLQEKSELESQILAVCPDMNPKGRLDELAKEAEVLEVEKKKAQELLKTLELEKSALFSRKQAYQEQIKDIDVLALSHWALLKDAISSTQDIEDKGDLKGTLAGLAKHPVPCEKQNLELALQLASTEAEEANSEMSLAKEKLTELKTLQERQKKAEKEIQTLAQEAKKAKGLKEEWEQLHLLIGKDEFRNYVLAMVEKLLIQQTNTELEKLCDGRYMIRHGQSSSKIAPDFYIIDKFRGDETRKVSTLSGGETFMVSLAMALALAEMTRGNADIDSFFIDEGFGTLDQDSLEEALDMLQDIETRGKQIGLISHVKELTQRIPVNIHLQKNRLGNSKIDIVYN